ncbi:putative disease resistance RPP13-like protein 1 [Pistacia vera]|uniref:putative disease resistance RPP13-like protein 1 n=1 Tax=Pistacia vera TaxID=55513 RepID=UPI001263245A|nr:putative disease resistance RPP13-like protein 1 [Pistacia vera]
MGNLINLHHLNNSNAYSLREMPLRIGNATGLITLRNFVVGKGSGSILGELKSLKHIRERLCISGLENVHVLDAKKADLNGKSGLNVIVLEWSSSAGDSREERNETRVLDLLRPHQGLKELVISGYGGTSFPIWLGDSSFSTLVRLTLENCSKSTDLPSVGQLPLLKYLAVSGMKGVRIVGSEFYGCSDPFPSLETLYFVSMEEWEEWIPHGYDQEARGFPHLRELSIIRCSKLVGRLPESLPLLERLVIRSCEQLLISVRSLPSLCKLEVEGCKQVVQRSTIDHSPLNPAVPTERFTNGLSKVEELKMVGCKDLTSLWQSRTVFLQDNASLCRLVIEDCPQLCSLVAEEEEEQQQQGLPCKLQYLKLSRCEYFVKLPQAILSLSSLTEIHIKDCPILVSFPETGLPPQLRVVEISECYALKSLPEAWMYNSNTSLETIFTFKAAKSQ